MCDTAMDPNFVRRSLNTIGKAVRMLSSHTPRRQLLQVLVATFVLHVALTMLFVKIASPAVNLDSMALFYGIEDNSTAAASHAVAIPETATVVDEAEETSPPWLWKLELLGELFWTLMLIITIFCFSKVFSFEDTESLRNGPVPSNPIHGANHMVRQGRDVTPGMTWREVKSLALVAFGGQTVMTFAFVLLEVSDMDDHLRKVTDFISCVCLVTVVVISSEGLYGFGAVDRAWGLVVNRYGDVSVFGVTFVLMQAAMYALWMTFSQGQKEVAAAVIREDTAAEMLLFSLKAAFAAVITQSFTCSVILVFYKESTGGIYEQHRREAVLQDAVHVRHISEDPRLEEPMASLSSSQHAGGSRHPHVAPQPRDEDPFVVATLPEDEDPPALDTGALPTPPIQLLSPSVTTVLPRRSRRLNPSLDFQPPSEGRS